MSLNLFRDPEATLDDLVRSGDAHMVQKLARAGLPVRELLRERVKAEMWDDNDCRQVGYTEVVKVDRRAAYANRCQKCQKHVFLQKLSSFPCQHRFCQICRERAVCPNCGPNFDRLWEIIAYTPDKHENPGVQWPEAIYSYYPMPKKVPELHKLVDTVVEASIEAFKKIDIEDMVAFALRKDVRGFNAFIHSHSYLTQIAAEQSRESKDRKNFWIVVCAAARRSRTTSLLHRTLSNKVVFAESSNDWEAEDSDSNPVYQETLEPIRTMYENYGPVEFLRHLPQLSLSLSCTGALCSSFSV